MRLAVRSIAPSVAWHLSAWNQDVLKMLPGFAAAMTVYGLWLAFVGRRAPALGKGR